jgi:DNA repair protein RecO (recombination protein O)
MTKRSRVFKTTGVILRRIDYGEADRLLTLFTPEYGKIRAIAKGVRRPMSKASGHVELYTVVDFVLSRGRNFHIVTQATLDKPFLGLRDDLQRIGYASHFVELIDRFGVDDEENEPAYHLLIAGLEWLSEPDVDLALVARYYELRMLDVMGYAPSLFDCALSGDPLEARDQFYSVLDGGVVSSRYVNESSHVIPLPLDVFKILRHFSRNSWDNIQGLKIRPHQHHILEKVLHATLTYLLEQRLQSVAFLRKIKYLNPDTDPQ